MKRMEKRAKEYEECEKATFATGSCHFGKI
jgi:hypothetical protein